MFKPKKILVPTDFSLASEKALQEAVDVAEEYHASITLLHVIEQGARQYEVEFNSPSKEDLLLASEKEEKSWDRMQDEVSKIPGANAVEIHFDVRQGQTADEILREQQEKDIDLIVIASHGGSGFSRMMLGSVSDKVLTKAQTPVLLIRA